MLTFNKEYFCATLLIFAIEILIALFIHDDFIRPYVGDVFVVILIYCCIKSFLRLPAVPGAALVLIFAFAIEFLQGIHFVDKICLEKTSLLRIVIGNTFAWLDLVAYTIGIAIVMIVEKLRLHYLNSRLMGKGAS